MHRWLGAMISAGALCLASASALAQGGYSVVSSGGHGGPTAGPAATTTAGTGGSTTPTLTVPVVVPGPRPSTPVTIGPPVGPVPQTVTGPAGPGVSPASPGSPLPGAGSEVPVTSITPTRGGGGGGGGRGVGQGVEVVTPRHPDEYGGVSPGSPTVPPGFRRMLRTSRTVPTVTWPGFQMVPSGSRIFLAMTAQPLVTVTRPAAHQVVYHLENARVFLSNNRRPLLTESFETPVQRTFLRTRGRGVDLVIELRADVSPRMSQESGAQGLSYLFVDFPPWTSPTIPRLDLPNLQVDSGLGGPTPPPGPAVMPRTDDNERPPPVMR